MTAEVQKYTREEIESLELAPGAEHEQLEGWVPSLASDEEVRDALEKAFDYRGDVTITTKSGEKVEAYVFNRQSGKSVHGSTRGSRCLAATTRCAGGSIWSWGPSSRRERTGRSRSSLGKCLAEGLDGLAALKE